MQLYRTESLPLVLFSFCQLNSHLELNRCCDLICLCIFSICFIFLHRLIQDRKVGFRLTTSHLSSQNREALIIPFEFQNLQFMTSNSDQHSFKAILQFYQLFLTGKGKSKTKQLYATPMYLALNSNFYKTPFTLNHQNQCLQIVTNAREYNLTTFWYVLLLKPHLAKCSVETFLLTV